MAGKRFQDILSGRDGVNLVGKADLERAGGARLDRSSWLVAERLGTLESPGDDLFSFMSVSDSIVQTASFDGGDGNDTLDASFGANGSATGGLTTSFTDNGDGTFAAVYTRSNSGTEGDDSVSIVNVENIFISIIGDSNGVGNGDFVQTGDGNDNIFTDNGADTIVAGKGVDTVEGGTSDEFGERDTISKDFSDVLVAIAWNIQTGAFSGPGSFTGVEIFGTLQTGGGNDTIVTDRFDGSSGRGDSSIATGAGNDAVMIFNGADIVDMGSGEDRLIIDYSEIFVFGGTMTTNEDSPGTYSGTLDTGRPNATFSGVEHFTILMSATGGNGSNGADTIIAGDGDDVVFGGVSSDNIHVGRGIDTVDGGETGTDIDGLAKEFEENAPAINFNLLANIFSGPGSYTNIEYFIDLKTGNGDDVVVTTGADHSDDSGNDVIATRGGNDTVTLFDGSDTVDLGGGNDHLILDFGSYDNTSFTGNTVMTLTETSPGSYSGSWTSAFSNGPQVTFEGVERFTIRTHISGGNGYNLADSIVTGDGDDSIFVERSSDSVVSGGGNDTIDGGASNDSIHAGQGHDLIYGGINNDKLYGEAGRDHLHGGLGNDSIEGGAGFDTAYFIESERTAGVLVDLVAGTATSQGGSEHDTLAGIEHVVGTAFADTMIGGVGGQTFEGGAGGDTLDGGSGIDWADYSDARRVISDLQIPTNNNRDAAGDSYISIENLRGGILADNLRGDGGDNRIEGGVRNDTLSGRAGDDTLVGGPGFDQLAGQAGTDSILLASTDAADYDRVVGFALDETFLLDGDVFGLAPGALDPDAFVLGAGARDAEDRIIYLESVGKLFFDPDGAGGASRELIAIIENRPEMSASDFLVI